MSGNSESWKAAWQPLVKCVGRNLEGDEIVWGADSVEAGAVRRYLEPLEFDCALHYDREAAREHGYEDIIVPYTGISSFAAGPLWQPGTILFDHADRNAQPVVGRLGPQLPSEAPPYTGYFGTDTELEFLRPVAVGERLGRRGRRLVACSVKETRIGRGAFVIFETEIVSSKGDVVTRMRYGLYCYNPHAEPVQEPPK